MFGKKKTKGESSNHLQYMLFGYEAGRGECQLPSDIAPATCNAEFRPVYSIPVVAVPQPDGIPMAYLAIPTYCTNIYGMEDAHTRHNQTLMIPKWQAMDNEQPESPVKSSKYKRSKHKKNRIHSCIRHREESDSESDALSDDTIIVRQLKEFDWKLTRRLDKVDIFPRQHPE